jgi:hypothetical protein
MMRVYLMRAEALERAKELFRQREGFHGFEVWDRARRVYSFPGKVVLDAFVLSGGATGALGPPGYR